jgi:hypothetical protein
MCNPVSWSAAHTDTQRTHAVDPAFVSRCHPPLSLTRSRRRRQQDFLLLHVLLAPCFVPDFTSLCSQLGRERASRSDHPPLCYPLVVRCGLPLCFSLSFANASHLRSPARPSSHSHKQRAQPPTKGCVPPHSSHLLPPHPSSSPLLHHQPFSSHLLVFGSLHLPPLSHHPRRSIPFRHTHKHTGSKAPAMESRWCQRGQGERPEARGGSLVLCSRVRLSFGAPQRGWP